jgi:hypothetical protein
LVQRLSSVKKGKAALETFRTGKDDAETVRKMTGWISSNVAGKTFADVGGIGVDAVNERVTLASKSGAHSVAMIDILPKEHHLWELFHQRCREEAINDVQCFDGIDINDPDLLSKVGAYDFVNCTGVVYHLPNPVWGVERLSKIVREYLMINTVIVPPKIETKRGRLAFPGSIAVFMPGLNPKERDVLDSYYMEKFDLSIDVMAPTQDAVAPVCPWMESGKSTCLPFWWLFTEGSFVALVEMMGFEIIDTDLWRNHALSVLARRKASAL